MGVFEIGCAAQSPHVGTNMSDNGLLTERICSLIRKGVNNVHEN